MSPLGRIGRLGCFLALGVLLAPLSASAEHSIAREWNELLLNAIRGDFARPTIHARNLFHTSIAMWDAWAAYDDNARTYLHHEKATAGDVEVARAEAISFAAYRVLSARFAGSPGATESLAAFDAKMAEHGYDVGFRDELGATPASLGNRIAATVLAFGLADGANEVDDYANLFYEPSNDPIVPELPGNPSIEDPNRWQPIALDFFIDQSGNVHPSGTPPFLSPEWGTVTPFALRAEDLTIYNRDGNDYWVYHDPGPPPQFQGEGDAEYKSGFEQVLEWSGLLDPADGVMIDIGPSARGNNTLGTNDGSGYGLNPRTGSPYAPNVVPAGDYYRILAEFWADGPDSETPPGHWFVLANYVSDHPAVVKKIGGVGDTLDPLAWDVALYLTLGGAMHDVAIAAWGAKGWYDYVRPVSAIRLMADLGQRSDPGQPSFHPDGIALEPGRVEVVTAESVAPGGRHAHLETSAIGKIAVRAWRGPDFIVSPETTTAGVGWIRVEDWWPYQRPTFVTPPFAGYVSGHSTFSRAAALVMTQFTGDAFFPGGVGEFAAARNAFLVFEDGPSVDVTLQWAKYYDAADECSLSRIYGGIHPPADDIPGRLMGARIGQDAFDRAQLYFSPPDALEIQRALVASKPASRGRIAMRGTLRPGGATNPDELDVSTGLTFSVDTGNAPSGVASLAADECVARSNGKISCRSGDRRLRAYFAPSKTVPGQYTFKLLLTKRSLPAELTGPVGLSIEDGNAEQQGSIESCVSKTTKLICRQR